MIYAEFVIARREATVQFKAIATAIRRLVHRFCDARMRSFCADKRGNIAVVFALATLPMIGFVGAAVDFSHGNSVKAAMQAALDSTALMLSKNAATMSNSELQSKANTYFKALLTRPEAKNIKVVANYSSKDGSKLVLDADATIDTEFMSVVGHDYLKINVQSTTAWGTSKLRVALVLDNSGSMSGSRMTALKKATKNLLITLQNASSKAGDVQVAIVPFTDYVNVGSSNYTANWIDWSEWDDENGYWSGWGWSKKWTPANHNTWNGCMTDRWQNYDIDNTTPTTSNSKTLFTAKQGYPCPSSIMPLGYNWTSLKNKVDGMDSNGWTNQPIGLVWGWHALTQDAPLFAPTLPKDTTQVIILLSDGENTKHRWHKSESSINQRQKKVCDNIKAAGIQLYTILLIDGDEDVMKDCASEPAMFFKLTSSNQVVTAFDTIGTNLAKLRVAK